MKICGIQLEAKLLMSNGQFVNFNFKTNFIVNEPITTNKVGATKCYEFDGAS